MRYAPTRTRLPNHSPLSGRLGGVCDTPLRGPRLGGIQLSMITRGGACIRPRPERATELARRVNEEPSPGQSDAPTGAERHPG